MRSAGHKQIDGHKPKLDKFSCPDWYIQCPFLDSEVSLNSQ